MAQSFEDEFEFLMPGYNVRPLELHSAVARVQLGKLDARMRARRENWDHFFHVAEDLPIRLPRETAPMISPFCLHFMVDHREARQRLANAFRAVGIDCRPPIAGSFRLQPYGARCATQRTPVADEIHWRGMAIGCPPFDGRHLIDMAVKVMRETL